MPSRTSNRAAACGLAVALALAVPAIAAPGEREPAGRARRQVASSRLPAVSAVGQAWAWLMRAWWGKNGVLIDPNGFRLFDTEAATGDRGLHTTDVLPEGIPAV
jgi:hypothetical protein